MSDQIIIPGGIVLGHEIPGFAVADRHTVFEWCMIYTNDHPAGTCVFFPDYDHSSPRLEDRHTRLQILGAAGSPPYDAYRKPMGIPNNAKEQIRNSFYRELESAIGRGQITPLVAAYCDDDPDVFDATRCLIDAEPVLELARRRRDAGQYILALLARADVAAKPDTEKKPRREKPIKRRERSQIVEALPVLITASDWNAIGIKEKCARVEAHLNKAKGWCAPRTYHRAAVDFERTTQIEDGAASSATSATS